MASGGRSGPAPQAHVLVADEDNSFLSGLLVGAMSQDAMGGLIQAEQVDQDEGRARMAKGEATAMLVIPRGFAQAVLMEQPSTLELVTNPSQTILPAIVEESLSILVDAAFYLHRLIGDDLREFAAGPAGSTSVFSDMRFAGISVRINQLLVRLSGYLFPPIVQLERGAEETVEADDADTVSVALLFLPGILFMALLFMAQGLSIDLWKERDQKTLRRVVVSPQHVLLFLFGKLLSGLGLMFVVCLVALTAGYLYFGLAFATLPLAVVWTLLSGALLMTIMWLLQLYASSQHAGGILTMVVMFPLMMAGGSFFPFEAMPAWMAAIGKRTPNGWALEQLKAILLESVEAGPFSIALVALIVVASVLFFFGALRLRSNFAQG